MYPQVQTIASFQPRSGFGTQESEKKDKRNKGLNKPKVIVNELYSYLIEKEDQDIGQVFFQLCVLKFEEILLKKMEVITQGYGRGKDHKRTRSRKEIEYGIDINEINVTNCAFNERFKDEKMSTQFVYLFWTKTIIEAQVKLKDFKKHTFALIDHVSEINIMSRKIYEIEKWSIDINYRWILKATNNE